MIHQFDANFIPRIFAVEEVKSAKYCCARKFSGWLNSFGTRNWRSSTESLPQKREELERMLARVFQEREIQAAIRIRSACL